MTLQLIEELAALLNRRGLASLEFEQEHACVQLTRGGFRPDRPSTGAVHESPVATASALVCRSPGFGLLRLAHPQRGGACVAPGDRIEKSQIVAFLQCGALLQEVTADHSGTLARLLAAEGELIGFGQPLFELQ